MYRQLLRLEKPQNGISKSNWIQTFSRRFSSSDSDDSEKSRKKQPIPVKSITVKVGTTDAVSDSSKHASKKIETLIKKAQNIKSISPTGKGTITQSMGKPKVFIRQSAKTPDPNEKPVQFEGEPIQMITHGLDRRLVEAARRVANKMPKHLTKSTEKELLNSIKKQKDETLKAKKEFENSRKLKEDFTKTISYQIMKESRQSNKSSRQNQLDLELSSRIGSTVEKVKLSPSILDELKTRDQTRSRASRNAPLTIKYRKDTSLFTGECLGIFDPKQTYPDNSENENPFWDKLLQQEIESTLQFPPKNAFEEMIQLTNEGKLWKYPINNEQDLDDDDTPFYEHVLLDNLLEGFPDKGPIRQFMELVIMGLSHNPYITVERKHETVEFYRNFFEEKDLFNLDIVESNESEESANL